MKTIFTTILLVLAIATFAQQQKSKNAKFTTEISGNCDHCKQRIEKTALSIAGVKSASWNVESKILTVIINEQKTDLATVKKAIAKSGHDTDADKTTPAIYTSLPQCCQYERK